MSIGNFNVTQEAMINDTFKDMSTVRECHDEILLGILMDSQVSEAEVQKKKPKFSFRFNLKNLYVLKNSAIVTARSLYQRLLITTECGFKKFWDIVMELVLAYNVVTTLYFLAYKYPDEAALIIDYICWVLFIADIFLTFFTEQLTDKGAKIRELQPIAVNYLKGSFIFDVLAVLPLRAGGYESVEYLLRMLRLLKLPSVLNITDGTGISYLLTFFMLGKKGKNGKITYSYTAKIIAALVQLCITIIFSVYFLGCLWFWFQSTVSNYKYSSDPSNNDENKFHDYWGFDGMETKDKVLRSSYYMLTTISTIGYGDYLPKNAYEMGFIMVVMLFGVTQFAIIMGNFNSAITFYTESTGGNDYTGELNTWLDSIERNHGKMNTDLRHRVINHFRYYFVKDRLKSLAKTYWTAKSDSDLISITQDYIKHLPEESYYEILENLFSDVLYNFKYYVGTSKFKYAILPHLQPREFLAKESLLSTGKKVNELMFVLTGRISIGIVINGVHRTLLYFEGGRTVIGDYSILTQGKNKFDHMAVSKTEVLAVDAEVFVKILDRFYPAQKTEILSIAHKREKHLKALLHEYFKNEESAVSLPTDFQKSFSVRAAKSKKKTLINGFTEDKVGSAMEDFVAIGSSLNTRLSSLITSTENFRPRHLSALKPKP